MDNIKISFDQIYERDLDLLFINKLMNDNSFINLFLQKVYQHKIPTHKIISIEHSMSDGNGESDITVIVESYREKIGLLIENKIDALAMPHQYDRYCIRGENGKANKLYDKYYVFITAPLSYLENNAEAQKYPFRISYEEMKEYFTVDKYASNIIQLAIDKQKKGYTPIIDKNVTVFWQSYHNFVKQNYGNLSFNYSGEGKGKNSVWVSFKTNTNNVELIHKSNKGFVDLTFSGLGEYYIEFKKLLKSYLSSEMKIEKTMKSLAIRIQVEPIDFQNSFDREKPNIIQSLIAIEKLLVLLEKLPLKEIEKLKC